MKKVAQTLKKLDKQIFEFGFVCPGAFIHALAEFLGTQDFIKDDTLEKLIGDFFTTKEYFYTDKDRLVDLVKEKWGYEVKKIRLSKNVFKISLFIDGKIAHIDAVKKGSGFKFFANGFPLED